MNLIKQAENVILKRKQKAEEYAISCYNAALKIPEFKQVEKAYNSFLPKLTRLEAFGIKDEEVKGKYLIAYEKRKEVLKKYNIKERNFKPKYSCLLCNDTGYKDGIACICLKQEINNIISIEYGIGKTFHSFESNSIESNPLYKMQLSSLYENMQKYCSGFPDTKYTTHIFTGLSGTGKTYLATCVARNIMEKGFTVIFVTAFKLNEIFLKYHLDFKGEGGDYLDNLYSCDFLVIDDLGTENTLKNVTNEYLLSLVSERLNNNKHTLLTTNLNGDQIRLKYDDRLHSRLLDKKKTYVFTFSGEDLRQIK